MLHVILLVLKVIGYLLLAILGLLLLIVLTVMFVPVRYRAKAEKLNHISASACVSWFFHLVLAEASFCDKKLTYHVRICGKQILGTEPVSKKQKADVKNDEKTQAQESSAEDSEDPNVVNKSIEETIIDEITEERIEEPIIDVNVEERIEEPVIDEITEERIEEPIIDEKAEEGDEEPLTDEITEERNEEPIIDEQTEERNEEPVIDEEKQEQNEEPIVDEKEEGPGFTERISNIIAQSGEKVQGIIQKIKGTYESIHNTVDGVSRKVDRYLRFWENQRTQNAYRHAKKEVFYLLKHYVPRKIEADLHFGFEDPATTGKVFGILCILQSISGNRIQAQPEFEEKIVEGTFFLKGHIRACHVLKAGLALLLDKNVRITFKRFRKLNG